MGMKRLIFIKDNVLFPERDVTDPNAPFAEDHEEFDLT